MLSVPGMQIPRKVAIKIARAEKLQESMKEGKKKINNKFKVTILGAKKRESSNFELSTDGTVNWTFSCIVKLHRNQTDPLSLLIEDSDGHHKGQVIIPLVKIPKKPYVYSANQDPATSNNILCSELEPTNKCNNPTGFLVYWIWVEEYDIDGQGDSGKKSFNKSMSSLFGSKTKLESSKTNLEIKNPDSISNYGSLRNLNKPEKHKTTPSLLKLSLGGKKKSKPKVADAKITPDSSDIDSLSNFSINQGNTFDHNSRQDRTVSHSSLADMENYNPAGGMQHVITLNKYDTNVTQRTEILSHSSHDSHTENQTPIKSREYNDCVSNNILPVIMAPYSNQNHVDSDRNASFKSTNSAMLPNKYNTLNLQDLNYHKEETSSIQNDLELNFRPGHVKSTIGSDYSIFNDRAYQPPAQSVSRTNYEDTENFKKENAELKAQNNKFNLQINNLQAELDSVKQSLCKLRCKLLEEGATKYLEI